MDEADRLAERFLNLAQRYDHTSLVADALYQQARNAMERNQYPPAQELLGRAIELYQGLGEQQKLAQSYHQLGRTFRYQANYSLALEYIYLSMQSYQQLGDKEAISNAHNSIGVVLEKMGQFEEASQSHQQALELNYELDDRTGIATSLYNLGDIRQKMGDSELALKYFQDALKLDLESGNPKDIAYSHNKIGAMYAAIGDYQQGREHIQTALALFRQIQAPRDTDWALTTLAQLALDEGNLEEAESLITGVIERAMANDYPSLLVEAYQVAAALAYQKQDYAHALTLIDAGLAQAKLNKERADEAILQKLRVQVHLANNSLKEAFEALQKQKRIDDEILNIRRLDSIAKVQAQTEFVRRAHQIELLEKEKALQEAEMTQQALSRNFWMLSIVAGFVLLFMLYGRFLQRRTNRRLGEEVALRTQELEQKNLELGRAYEEMEAISLTDKLTGIHNRRFLENHIDADLQQSHRVYQDWRNAKAPKPVQADIVAFIIDMDDFKQVNDLYGHQAGDRVLSQLAARMAKVFRHSDYLVRWGGEEFVAVARFIERADAAQLAQRMLDAVNQEPFALNDRINVELSCSIGFACYPLAPHTEAQHTWPCLVGTADACLYAVKTAGKNAWMGVESAQDPDVLKQDMTPRRLQALMEQGLLKVKAPMQEETTAKIKRLVER